MSFLHPEEQRVCQMCGHVWFAEKWTKSSTSPPLVGAGFGARSQALAKQTVHQQRIRRYEAWAKCASCGSKKVKTSQKPQLVTGNSQPNPAVAATPESRPSPAHVPAGWYTDPLGIAGQLRYWDGSTWTNSTASPDT